MIEYSQEKLLPYYQFIDLNKPISVKDKNGQTKELKQIKLKVYKVEGYNSFNVRRYKNKWILSVKGKLVTYGSYTHCIDVMRLIKLDLTSWESESSIIYFLQTDQYKQTIQDILLLRTIDQLQHNPS